MNSKKIFLKYALNPLIYKQPIGLCGLSCVKFISDVIKGEFEKNGEDFRQEIERAKNKHQGGSYNCEFDSSPGNQDILN